MRVSYWVDVVACFGLSLKKYVFRQLPICPSQIYLHFQIGSNMFLTAAHCLENWAGEVQEPSELTVFLGVHNKGNLERAK